MSARSKRLLKLALGDSTTGADAVKIKEHNNKRCKLDNYEIKDLNNDPWIEYKEWKRQEIEPEQEHKSNHTGDQSKSPTEYIDSSISWQPNETEESTSECQSSISNEIKFIKPILVYKKQIDNIGPTQTHLINNLNSGGSTRSKEIAPKQKKNIVQTSWEPNEREESTSECQSSTSNEIRVIKPILVNKEQVDNIGPTPIHLINNLNSGGSTNSNEIAPKQKKNIVQNVGLIGDSKKIVDVSHRKSRIWDKRDRCVYCNQDFTNYSRHLFRKHGDEDSVSRIMQLRKGDNMRKRMINLLRNEGNLTVLHENKIRPVQRSTGQGDSEKTQEFIPCPYCKGIYRLTTLRKHSKKCSYNPHNDEKCNIASLGQNLLVFRTSRKSFLDKLRLKNEVFPNMHADRASFHSKNDPVICQYGEDYLRKHKRPHIKNAVSNKIRELGRLLIPLQEIYGINTILEAMNPIHYDKVVHATQIISGYDITLKTFKSPSLAMHMKTILLAACLAAKTLLLKQDHVLPVTNYTEALNNVKQFRLLVDERWKFDMGSLALKDLNEKHGKKSQTLPITSDVIKFRQHAVNIAEQSMAKLKQNFNDLSSFKVLTEAALVLTIVLNRKRVGDVQYIRLSINQEECVKALSESEKVLSAHFKRIITIGKGSKSIPILFPKNVQSYLEVLLTSREKNEIIPKENPFLFALTFSKDKWVDGSAVLRKYAANCGAENPKTLTSSRLRKQIATILQLLNLNEIEKEQVASFMGHTKKTHEEFYRLPQDVFQTAKIAKLLLMMDKGDGAKFQGKTLEEIDVHLENLNEEMPAQIDSDIESEDQENIDTLSKNEELYNKDNTEIETLNLGEGSSNIGKKKENGKVRQRGSWNNKQKSKMKECFVKHIRNKITPKKDECIQFKNDHRELFDEKTWVQIKVFVYNTFKSK